MIDLSSSVPVELNGSEFVGSVISSAIGRRSWRPTAAGTRRLFSIVFYAPFGSCLCARQEAGLDFDDLYGEQAAKDEGLNL